MWVIYVNPDCNGGGVTSANQVVNYKIMKKSLLALLAVLPLFACQTEDPEAEEQKRYEKECATPLTFTATGEVTLSIQENGEFPDEVSFEYRLNDGDWAVYEVGQEIALGDGDKVSFQAGEAGNKRMAMSSSNYHMFVTDGEGTIAASGNIMSLLDRTLKLTSIEEPFCFAKLFYNCWCLTTPPVLPATALSDYCYYKLFLYCGRLTSVPKLPATELAEGCYQDMFNNCLALTTAPELPATNLAPSCYLFMFCNCESLANAPALPATELAELCYDGMFTGCSYLPSAP